MQTENRKIDITDKSHEPDIAEITSYIGNPLFTQMYEHISAQYKALCSIAYSGDKVLLGWNVSFKKGGRALCRLYPKPGFFSVLVVVGQKEKKRVQELLPQMCNEVRDIYESTKEGMGQRWLLIDLKENDDVYRDVLRLIAIRRESEK